MPLNVIILYNAHLKANEVIDDWNMEMIQDPYLHYFLSLLQVHYAVNNWA